MSQNKNINYTSDKSHKRGLQNLELKIHTYRKSGRLLEFLEGFRGKDGYISVADFHEVFDYVTREEMNESRLLAHKIESPIVWNKLGRGIPYHTDLTKACVIWRDSKTNKTGGDSLNNNCHERDRS